MPRTPVVAAIIVAVLVFLVIVAFMETDGPAVDQPSANPHAIEQQ